MNYIYNNYEEKTKLLERFVRYAKICSESNEKNADNLIMPSTECQWDFAKILVKELRALGTRNVYLTDFCYVVAKFDSNIEDSELRKKYPPILLMSHLDTVDEISGKDVNPIIQKVDANNSPTKTDDIIVKSDGTTLLGADDKAGICAIMTALEYINNHNEDFLHGPIEVVFSPDEETGHGMDKVPLQILKSKMGITVDGGDEGELEAECFNAWSGCVKFTGIACHTGYAKNKMINATTLASNFISLLPYEKSPEMTEEKQGFIAPMDIQGTIENSEVNLLLRSFDTEEIEEQKKIINDIANSVINKFGGKVEIEFKNQYLNMKEKIAQNPEILTRLEKAFRNANVEIKRKSIRGGTDGSRLTQLQIPTPNIFTGAHDFHSRNEWLSINQCAKSADVIINLLTNKDF